MGLLFVPVGSSLPKGQAAAASKEVAYLGGKKVCEII